MKRSISVGAKQRPEQYQRREAWLERADTAPLPPRAGELPLEDYEKRLMAEDGAASRAQRKVPRS
ncbi:MAG: hypothetical protein QOI11_455 [Candidatus Eremiobacteraeota bacterium]|jgi:hypothetical protein|nr:hypothetical protein [Candidatus Eremiobacteraeota bacterium]